MRKPKINGAKAKAYLKLARAGFDIWLAIRKKDLLYAGSALISSCGAVESFVAETQSISSWLRKNNMEVVFQGGEDIAYDVLKQAGFTESTVLAKDTAKIIELTKGTHKFYFSKSDATSSVRSLYSSSEEITAAELSEVIKENFGNSIQLLVKKTGWNVKLVIQPFEHSGTVFVSPEEEKDFFYNTAKFCDKGISRSSIIYGPPGVGKTTLASRLSEKMDRSLVVMNSAVIENTVGGSFLLEQVLSILAPGIIVFDDIDKIRANYLENFISTVESLNKSLKKTIILCTVNDINRLPEAMRRPGRFDEIIELKPPSDSDRKKILEGYLNFFGTRLSNSNVEQLVADTDGMTGAFIKEVATQATILSVDQVRKKIEIMKSLAIKSTRRCQEEPEEAELGIGGGLEITEE